MAAGLFTYFYIMNDYGFTPQTLLGITDVKSYMPLDSDVYSPDLKYKGNSCADRVNIVKGCEGRQQEYLFDNSSKHSIDARLFYWERQTEDWSSCRWTEGDGSPNFWS